MFVFSGLNFKVLFSDLCVRWNLRSEMGINEKKKKIFLHDSKITVQVFNTLLSKFSQIITDLTEDTELAFTIKLKRLYLIIILLTVLQCFISWMNQIQMLLLSFLMNVLTHFPNFISPSEVLSYAINYLSKVAFTNLQFSQAMQLWFHFLKQKKTFN